MTSQEARIQSLENDSFAVSLIHLELRKIMNVRERKVQDS